MLFPHAFPTSGQLTSVTDQHATLQEEHSRTSSALAKLEADHCISEANLDRLDKDLAALRQVKGGGGRTHRERKGYRFIHLNLMYCIVFLPILMIGDNGEHLLIPRPP